MPNWVKTIVHAIKDDADFSKFVGEDGDFTFQKIVPRPESEEDNWYDWDCAHWGTKWDACDVDTDKRTVIFNTAWEFALPVLRELAKKVGGLLCFYADEDIGRNCGALFIRADGSLKEIDTNTAFAECVWGNLDLQEREDCISRFSYDLE